MNVQNTGTGDTMNAAVSNHSAQAKDAAVSVLGSMTDATNTSLAVTQPVAPAKPRPLSRLLLPLSHYSSARTTRISPETPMTVAEMKARLAEKKAKTASKHAKVEADKENA